MSGYYGFSKSNRAIKAEQEGKMTATAMSFWLRSKGKRYKGCNSSVIKAALFPCEFHHTSKYYNKTNYYDPRDLLSLELRQSIIEEISVRRDYRRLVREHEKKGMNYVVSPAGTYWYDLKLAKKEKKPTRSLVERLKTSLNKRTA